MKNAKLVIGWIAVLLSLVFFRLWAYWGAFENFHEGWYSESIWENLFMLFFQYLIFPIVFVSLALIALKWKKSGLLLHFAVAVFSVFFFSGSSFIVIGLMIVIPILVIGGAYFWGEPEPRKWARRLLVFIPLIIILIISIPHIIKISQRSIDYDLGVRTIEGNGVSLYWAPRGPGWPDGGVSWHEADEICRHLSEDGMTLKKEEQNIWGLPNVDEIVRSMQIHEQNAGGFWDSVNEKATYDKMPDKETPLWDVNSKIIYYWTADSARQDEQRAYIIVYNGGVYDRRKIDKQGNLSF